MSPLGAPLALQAEQLASLSVLADLYGGRLLVWSDGPAGHLLVEPDASYSSNFTAAHPAAPALRLDEMGRVYQSPGDRLHNLREAR